MPALADDDLNGQAQTQWLTGVSALVPTADPVFNYLKKASGDESDIGWNFGKFLVGKDGSVIKR